MKFTKLSLILAIFFLISNSVSSQTKLPLNGLKNNAEYMELVGKSKILATKQDSILKVIETKKKELTASSSDQTKADKLTNEILNFEGHLFEIRSELGIVSGKATQIEQEYLIANMGKGENITPSPNQQEKVVDDSAVTNIFEASSIKKEVTAEEMDLFSKVSDSDKKIEDAFLNIETLKIQLDTIYTKYRSTGDKIEGDSLFGEFQKVKERVKNIDFEATRLWDNIFNTKIYVVNRLMDKFSAPQSNIEYLNEISRNSRSEESDIDANFLAANISKVQRQKIVALEYEKVLAKQLKLNKVVENIEKTQKSIVRDIFDIETSSLPEQEMIEYAPIKRILSEAHTANNPPKELTIPSRGELYKIAIGTYSKELTSYVSFYRVSPVEYYQLESGKFRYWGGSYKTKAAAEKDSKMLNRLGMRTSVDSWINGENSEDPSLSVGEYKIEIKNFTSQIRDLVAKETEGKDILRSTDLEGNAIFSVGIFSTKGEARRVADLIGKDAKVVLAK